jgi:hypothetical protein
LQDPAIVQQFGGAAGLTLPLSFLRLIPVRRATKQHRTTLDQTPLIL